MKKVPFQEAFGNMVANLGVIQTAGNFYLRITVSLSKRAHRVPELTVILG